MKLGQYIVIGGLAYFAFFMLRGRKTEEENLISGGVPTYSDDFVEIDRGNGIIEYRSDDGKLSSVNVGTYNPNPQASQRSAIDRTVSPTPSAGFGMNSYTSINGNGRSVSF